MSVHHDNTAALLQLTTLTQSLTSYNSHSRIHKLKSIGDAATTCYVKRDDELSFGISGSKIRKYLSLIPFLIARNIKRAIVIGGAYSNHVLGISQLLIENDIEPILFLLGDDSYQITGNLLLTQLCIKAKNIHWIARKDWPRVDKIAQAYLQQYPQEIIVIPEGALMSAALPGALTLAVDILRNEQQLNLNFAHIFIEAGTGLMAIALILAMAWLKKTTIIHVLLLADTAELFQQKLAIFKAHFEDLLKKTVVLENSQFKLYYPQQARAFGATNTQIFHEIAALAQQEGFLTDPIYSAKLFLEAKTIIKQQKITGNSLIIHSGGALTLMGFQDQLKKVLP